ncbi:hypothetical protein [Paraburkholderia caffeinitolerans]|uniref:hypothetical protein n=1 Tax=Paraburkholderia caffeinitolerans TaxID=1723730 RepID=UPI001581BC1B|nr:hypothetical protein [Paraburkholderia caffeinitolerans]
MREVIFIAGARPVLSSCVIYAPTPVMHDALRGINPVMPHLFNEQKKFPAHTPALNDPVGISSSVCLLFIGCFTISARLSIPVLLKQG